MSKVSVFMPVYNSEHYLDDSIQSILSQTFTNFNLIIVNDGSTDNSINIVKKYKQSDKRISLIDKPHMGTAITRNAGLGAAKGEYLALIDSDDKMHSKRLAEQVTLLDNNKDIIACGTQMRQFGEKSHIVKQPVDPDIVKIGLMFSPSISNPTAMMRLNKIVENKITYRETDLQSQDYRFWTKVSTIGKITNIDKELYYYRCHQAQVTQAHRHNQLKIHKEIVSDLLQVFGIQLTDYELSVFLLDEFRGDETPSKTWNLSTTLPTLIGIFDKLIYVNNNNSFLNKEKLNTYLCTKYENICLLFGLKGLNVGKLYGNRHIKIRSRLLPLRLLSRYIKGYRLLSSD